MNATPLDLLTILYQTLKGSAIWGAVGQRGYKSTRPAGVGESYVVNALPVSQSQTQRGTGNVNIYAPNIDVKRVKNGVSESLADTVRLNELVQMALPVLSVYTNRYDMEPAMVTLIEEPETDSHYMNIRIDFTFYPAPQWS